MDYRVSIWADFSVDVGLGVCWLRLWCGVCCRGVWRLVLGRSRGWVLRFLMCLIWVLGVVWWRGRLMVLWAVVVLVLVLWGLWRCRVRLLPMGRWVMVWAVWTSLVR